MQVINGRYRLHELTLTPSYGEVYVAYDLVDFSTRSLWVMPFTRNLHARSFISTQKNLQSIADSGLPNIYSSDIDLVLGKIYVVFDHFHAVNLYNVLQNNQQVSYKEAVNILLQLIHIIKVTEKHTYHGRINPQNIISRDRRIQLLGFGLSYLQKVSEMDGEMRLYLSPEQLAGKNGDSLSDLYSIGMIFFRLLFGFTTYKQKEVTAQIEEFIPPNEMALFSPPWRLVKGLVLRILSESPADRRIPYNSDGYMWIDNVEF